MDQEKHFTEQEIRKPVTKATARHLRRKRLKDARRAEERQYLDILNGVSSHIKSEETDNTTKDNADISDKSSLTSHQKFLQLTRAVLDKSVFSHSSVNLSLSDPLNDLTIAAYALKKLASLESSHDELLNERTNLPLSYCSSNVVDEAKSVNGAENLFQTTNGKKKRKKRNKCVKSPITGATLEEDSQNASSSTSESSVSNLNYDSNCSANILDSVENVLEQSSEKSDCCAQESISLIKMTDEEPSLLEKTEPTTDSQPVRESKQKETTCAENDIQSDPATISKNEESNICEPMLSIKTADDKSSLPGKTREEVKAEREAKKAAKAAAKAKAKGKKTEEVTDDIKNELPPTGHKVSIGSSTTKPVVTDAQNSQKTDDVVVTSSQSPQLAKETEGSSKETVAQLCPIVQSVESSAVSRQDISDEKNEDKSKAELRAERRAKQEAQRAAKQLQQSTVKQQEASTKRQPSSVKSDTVNQETPLVKPRMQQAAGETAKRVVKRDNDHEVNLFKHLYNERELSLSSVPVNSNIHPAIIGLGAQYAGRTIVGSNARCVALLAAVKQVIQDFVMPEQTDFTRSLEVCLRDLLAYLHRCRPVAVSMQNAMRHLKWHMTTFPVNISTDEAKTKLIGIIDTYITEQIKLAGKAISITIQTKISNGDIILIYGFSSLICNILVYAHTEGKKFRVIVVDGRPWLEGREQLRRLVKHGIDCSYMYINAVSFIMPEVSKVFLSAHAILANGAVMSRVGTSQVALIAKAFNVPVLVACETHKTCGRVQTDSIVYNELGNADDLVNSRQSSKKSPLTNWRARKSLNLLNITYDVTPADLITAVVTELAILPCTSVPVILRIKPSEF